MSIENHLQELTKAVTRLADVLERGAVKAEGPTGAPTPKPAKAPETSAATPAVAKKGEAPVLTFDTLAARFRVLAGKNREAAVAILTKLGVAKLGEAKLEQYPVIDEELTKGGV